MRTFQQYFPPTGASFVIAALRKAGHQVRVHVAFKDSKIRELDRLMEELRPEVVCFTAVYTEYEKLKNLSAHIRERQPGLYQVLGGPHPIINPDSCAQDPWDAICLGEGEIAAVELVDALAGGKRPKGLAGFLLRREDGTWERNPVRPYLEELDELPFMARDIWERYWPKESKIQVIVIGRGCPYKCRYCSIDALRASGTGRYIRQRTGASIARELTELCERYPELETVWLESETVVPGWRHFADDICEALSRFNDQRRDQGRSPLLFGTNINIAPRSVDFELLFARMAKANLRWVQVGLETGSERLRSEVLDKHFTNERYLEVRALARKHGIRFNAYVLVGIPGETREDFQQTKELLMKDPPDEVVSYITFPYPGTPMYRMALSAGYLEGEPDLASERARAALTLPDFPKRAIEREWHWLEYDVYRGLRSWRSRAMKVLYKKGCTLGWFGWKWY